MVTKTKDEKRTPTSPQSLNEPGKESFDSHNNSKSPARTKLIVRCDVGFGNHLTLRGKGANLNWDKGIPLKNNGSDSWVWETEAPFKSVEFKVLINDYQYETGDNHKLDCGSTQEYRPDF